MTQTQKRRMQALHSEAHNAVERLVDAFRYGTLEEQVEFAAQAAQARRAALRIEAEA